MIESSVLTEAQGATLAEDIELLLYDMCLEWGWCSCEVFGVDLVRAGNGLVTAGAVARALMEEEGEDPAANPRAFRALERFFQYRYGAPSISEAEYAPGLALPYSILPPAEDVDVGPPDPILLVARRNWRRARGEAEFTEADEAEARLAALGRDPGPDDVMRTIRVERSKRIYTLPAERFAAKQDLRALILLYEEVSGQFWAQDPETRGRLGFGDRPGTLAGATR